jgi:hypothetical protein
MYHIDGFSLFILMFLSFVVGSFITIMLNDLFNPSKKTDYDIPPKNKESDTTWDVGYYSDAWENRNKDE